MYNTFKPDKQPMLMYVQTCTEMKGVVLTGILRWLISLRLADPEQLANAKVVMDMIARFLGAFTCPPWWGCWVVVVVVVGWPRGACDVPY